MKVNACLKLASSALIIGSTAGSDRLRRTQARAPPVEIVHGWEWLTNGERDIGTALANVGIFAKQNATTNSTMPAGMGNTTMPGSMANSTMPGMANTTTTTNTTTNGVRRTQARAPPVEIVHGWEWLTNGERDIGTALANVGIFAKQNATTNSTMPAGMGNTTMPGMANSTMPGMANTTTTANVTRRAQAANHASTPMDGNTTDAAGMGSNATMPGMANNTMPAGTNTTTPTRSSSTTVGGRNVSSSTPTHRRTLRAMPPADYASSIANTHPVPAAANSTSSAAVAAAHSTINSTNSTMPAGAANATTNSTMPTRFLTYGMRLMANGTMPAGMDNATMPMDSHNTTMTNSTMPMGVGNATTNSTMGVGATRFVVYNMMANETMPGMVNGTMPMGSSHNTTTNSTMPMGVGNATVPMTNTTISGSSSN